MKPFKSVSFDPSLYFYTHPIIHGERGKGIKKFLGVVFQSYVFVIFFIPVDDRKTLFILQAVEQEISHLFENPQQQGSRSFTRKWCHPKRQVSAQNWREQWNSHLSVFSHWSRQKCVVFSFPEGIQGQDRKTPLPHTLLQNDRAIFREQEEPLRGLCPTPEQPGGGRRRWGIQ